jgi:hypothetical protein
MKADARAALTMLSEVADGINEAMLETHGFPAALLDRLVAAGHARFENRRYGARGNLRFEITVRRFYITAAGQAALNGANK